MTETAREIFNRMKGGGAAPPRVPPTPPTTPPPPLELPPTPDPVWPQMADAAYHGLAGQVVQRLEPHTEADPAAILIQFLTAAGNIIGRQPHYRVESDTHHANLFTVLVGESSKARKGTSWGRICEVARGADENWYLDRNKGGLSSGEGLINEVRDPVEKFDVEAGMMKMIDPGVPDKRLMVIEPEFAGALLAADRHGNTLSPIIRKGWDGGRLATMTRSSPLKATNPHISIIGHITVQELRARLTRTDMANGFANRFLFMLVKRSRILPFGGVALELSELAADVHNAAEFAQRIGRVDWAAAARPEWVKVYTALSSGRPGLLGALTSRAEAQVVRLALIYAVLDGSPEIDVQHLRAPLAVWGYAEDSTAFIFGQSLGDPVADDILRALRQAGADGMSRTAIRDLFGRHKSTDQIGAALATLASQGQAKGEMRASAGRPAEVWIATGAA